MAIEIVPSAEEHAEGFHAALDVVAREKRYLVFLAAPPPEATRAFVRRGAEGSIIQFVALDDGRVVGWCDIIPSERRATHHQGTLGIGLLPDYRGAGLGARLILTALEAARARGLVRIALHVRADNTRAIALYERLGFRHEGRLRRDIRIDGEYYDSLAMALMLDETAP